MKRPKIHLPKPALAHIAEVVQKHLKAESISMQEFGRRLGVPGRNKTSVVRGWALGIYAPTEHHRESLAKALNLEAEFFLPRREAVGPARQARAVVSKVKIPVAKSPDETKLLRSFEEHSDGTVTVKFTARLPLTKAREIFSQLIEVSL